MAAPKPCMFAMSEDLSGVVKGAKPLGQPYGTVQDVSQTLTPLSSQHRKTPGKFITKQIKRRKLVCIG